MRWRVAMVCSHAIQYFMPWFRELAREPDIDLTVILGDDHGLDGPAYDPGFGTKVRWDVPLRQGLHIEVLKNRSPRPGVGRFSGIINPGMLSQLTPRRFDAVVIHGWNYACYPLALLGARLHGVPVLIRCESPLLPGEAPPSGQKRRLLGGYIGQCAAALAASTGNRRLLRAYGMPDERIFSCPYAVDGGRFALPKKERQRARAEWRERLGVADDVPLVLFVGKLQAVKDPLLLTAACARLRAQGQPVALALVGEGELRGQIAQDSATHLLGFRNQGELAPLYAAADLLCLPSVRETFGLVICEAMHAGLPVVCSDTVGCAEDLVLPDQTGATFSRLGDRAQQVEALCTALRPLLAREEQRLALSRGAQRIIKGWTFAQSTLGLRAALQSLGLESRR